MIFNPKSMGADAEGKKVSTDAIQHAIDACFEAGGGTVLLEGGKFVSGTLYMKSNVRLKIEGSAVLYASPDISDYGDDTHCNRYVNEHDMDRCFIYAEDAQNIEICGSGLIDGNAESFPNEGDIYRPMMFRFLRCGGIRLHGLRLYNAAAWTTAFLDSENIWAYKLDIKNDKRYNGDGLDFDGCRNVFVEGCKIEGTDDNLCLQSSSTRYPMQNVHISDCMFTSLCAGIRIGLKSIGTISEVAVENCTFENVWREGIKIECSEGGEIRGINASGLVMKNVSRPLFVILNNRFADIGTSVGLEGIPKIGVMKDIRFSNVIIRDTEEMKKTHMRFEDDVMGSPKFKGIRIDAADKRKIENVTISGLSYESAGGVKAEEIPQNYPEVKDLRDMPDSDERISENYYPDWSRAAFMDIRNVDGLYLSDIVLTLAGCDERKAYILEKCNIRKEEIFVDEKVKTV